MSAAEVAALAFAVSAVSGVITVALAVAYRRSVARSHDLANGVDPLEREALTKEPKL